MYRITKNNLPTSKRKYSNHNKIYIVNILKENMSGPLYLKDSSIIEALERAKEPINKARGLRADLTQAYRRGSIGYELQEALDLRVNGLYALIHFAVREDTDSLDDLEDEERTVIVSMLQVLDARAKIPGTIHYSPEHKTKDIEGLVFMLEKRKFNIPEEFRHHLPQAS